MALLNRILLLAGLFAVAPPSLAGQQALPEVLGFEASDVNSTGISGWRGGPPETLLRDSSVVRSGQYSGRIQRSADSSGDFSVFTSTLPWRVAGEVIELRGWLRTERVEGWAGLWLRQDGAGQTGLQFDNMGDRPVEGTTGWTEYRIVLPLDDATEAIYFGALVGGEGTAWVDDLELLVDGRPIGDAPPRIPSGTAAEQDREFDGGSGLDAIVPSPAQVESLAMLGKVWGFLKYHHPRVAAGELNWDYELFRVLPGVLAAENRAAAADRISTWLDGIGVPLSCTPCARAPLDPQIAPPIAWIFDVDSLGPELSRRLAMVHERRFAGDRHHYVTHMPQVGNPVFELEAAYTVPALPDAGFRLLALFRYWNIIEYLFPYRDLIDEDWDDVLVEFIPRFAGATEVDEYRGNVLELVARIDDTHGRLIASTDYTPPVGTLYLPIDFQFVDGRPVVTGYLDAELGPATGLRRGDVITHIDGVSVESLIAYSEPFIAASNRAGLFRTLEMSLLRGATGPVGVTFERADATRRVTAERVPARILDFSRVLTHDLPGETFQMLGDDVAYLKLSTVRWVDVPGYIERAQDAAVLVVDIRNYPSEFVVFAIGNHLVGQPTEFVRFTSGDLSNPGAFIMGPPLRLEPLEPRYRGKVVVLVDEVTLSQAEYTAMALRAAPGAIVVGSQTAGADGNVSQFSLPGGIGSTMTGIGVFYPDGTPTQQVGIVPDLVVEPTIEGIREGRDEVLEAAVSHALGREFRLSQP